MVPSVQAFSAQAYLALQRYPGYPRKHEGNLYSTVPAWTGYLYFVPVLVPLPGTCTSYVPRTCTCTYTSYPYLHVVPRTCTGCNSYLVPVLVLVPRTFYTCTSYVYRYLRIQYLQSWGYLYLYLLGSYLEPVLVPICTCTLCLHLYLYPGTPYLQLYLYLFVSVPVPRKGIS